MGIKEDIRINHNLRLNNSSNNCLEVVGMEDKGRDKFSRRMVRLEV